MSDRSFIDEIFYDWDKPKTKSCLLSQEEFEMILLPEKLPSIQVMEQLVLPSESNIMTSLSLELTPYLEMPISCIGDSRFFVLGMIGPTQGGKSTFLQVAVADTISQSPGTCLYILPDMKQGIKQIHEKITGPVKRTPQLYKYVVQPESKTLTNDAIKLSHMTLYLGWSNSPASLSSTPCTRVFFDEVRLFKKELGNESNALMLGLDRLTIARSMGLAQAYMVSTPSDEGDLLYQQLQIPDTTVLHWYWCCPHCDVWFIPDFFAMVRPIDNKLTSKLDEDVVQATKSHQSSEMVASIPVSCHCPYCNGVLSDRDSKKKLNKHGRYAQEGQNGTKELVLGPLTERLFFRFDSMVSPFRPFQMIYDEYIRTKKHVNDYKNFFQAWLARFWKLTLSTLTKTDLELRKCDEVKTVVPLFTKVITAGVDTQDDGFYVVVRCWGADRETIVLDEFHIPCKIDEMLPEQAANLFKKQVEDRIYKSAHGVSWKIAQYAIDTGGHRTKEVYLIADYLTNMCLIKGKDDQTETIRSSSQVFGLFTVRTGDYLEETENACTKAFWKLPMDISEEFLQQWLSAKKTWKVTGGKKKVVWDKVAQNDFRYADVHSYIALDLPWSNSTFRRSLETPDWSYNPVIIANEEIVTDERFDAEDEDETKSRFSSDFGLPSASKQNTFSFKWCG